MEKSKASRENIAPANEVFKPTGTKILVKDLPNIEFEILMPSMEQGYIKKPMYTVKKGNDGTDHRITNTVPRALVVAIGPECKSKVRVGDIIGIEHQSFAAITIGGKDYFVGYEMAVYG